MPSRSQLRWKRNHDRSSAGRGNSSEITIAAPLEEESRSPQGYTYSYALLFQSGGDASAGGIALLRALESHGVCCARSRIDASLYLLRLAWAAALREAELMGIRLERVDGTLGAFSAPVFARGGVFAPPPPLEVEAAGDDRLARAFKSGDRVRLLQHLIGRLTVLELHTSMPSSELLLPHPFDGGDAAHSSAFEVAQPRLVAAVFPLHCKAARAVLKQSLVYGGGRSSICEAAILGEGPPLRAIRSYFGVRIAFYFCFLHSYTKWIAGLTLFGAAVRLVVPRLVEVELFLLHLDVIDPEVAIAAVGGCGAVAWSVAFLKAWQREQHSQALAWDVTSLDETDEPRVQWHDATSECWQQTMRVVSCVATLTAILLAGTCSFILMQWDDHWATTHPVGMGGRSFVMDSLVGLVPTVTLVVALALLDTVWSAAAPILTELENFETQQEYRWSLVAKLAVFQFMNNMGWLLYVVFIEPDPAKLRKYLLTVLLVKQLFIEQAIEIGVPLLTAAVARCRHNSARRRASSRDAPGPESESGEKETRGTAAAAAASSPARGDSSPFHSFSDSLLSDEMIRTAEEEAQLAVYAVDDDFIELFVQFARVILFAAAMPIIAPLSALINNLFEIRTDALKLLVGSRRPKIETAAGIGAWSFAFNCVSMLAIVTNIVLIMRIHVSSTQQSNSTSCSSDAAAEGHSSMVDAVIGLVLQHNIDRWSVFVFFLLAVMRNIVSDVPQHVEKERLHIAREARKELLKRKAMHAMKLLRDHDRSSAGARARSAWRRMARAFAKTELPTPARAMKPPPRTRPARRRSRRSISSLQHAGSVEPSATTRVLRPRRSPSTRPQPPPPLPQRVVEVRARKGKRRKTSSGQANAQNVVSKRRRGSATM